MRITAVGVAAILAAVVTVRADEPTLEMVLARAAGYVASYQEQLRGLVAEETSTQNSTNNVFGGKLRGSRVRATREGRANSNDHREI